MLNLFILLSRRLEGLEGCRGLQRLFLHSNLLPRAEGLGPLADLREVYYLPAAFPFALMHP